MPASNAETSDREQSSHLALTPNIDRFALAPNNLMSSSLLCLLTTPKQDICT
jgi:hypothetical protein